MSEISNDLESALLAAESATLVAETSDEHRIEALESLRDCMSLLAERLEEILPIERIQEIEAKSKQLAQGLINTL